MYPGKHRYRNTDECRYGPTRRTGTPRIGRTAHRESTRAQPKFQESPTRSQVSTDTWKTTPTNNSHRPNKERAAQTKEALARTLSDRRSHCGPQTTLPTTPPYHSHLSAAQLNLIHDGCLIKTRENTSERRRTTTQTVVDLLLSSQSTAEPTGRTRQNKPTAISALMADPGTVSLPLPCVRSSQQPPDASSPEGSLSALELPSPP